MNLPNKLTLLRIVLILPFLLVLYLDVPFASYIALAIVFTFPDHPAAMTRPLSLATILRPLTANSRWRPGPLCGCGSPGPWTGS